MKDMTPTNPNDRVAMTSLLRRWLLVTAVISTLLTGYVGGYIALRYADIITDFSQHGSPYPTSRWVTLANVVAKPIYWLELRWRISRMDQHWQRCADVGLCPDGERKYGDRLAEFWYRQGYLDAIPDAMTNAICGYASFTGPLLDVPAGSYQQGLFDGERIVQRVVRDFLVQLGVPRWNGQATPVDDGAEQIQFSGSRDDHEQFQRTLDAMRTKFSVSRVSGSVSSD
jgi:hypothetical protein